MDPYASPNYSKNDDYEVTGVSRSGRVRKKPSKLTDFGSCEETADKQQKAKRSDCYDKYEAPGPSRSRSSKRGRKLASAETAESSTTETRSSESEEEKRQEVFSASRNDPELASYARKESPRRDVHSQADSLYMLEKSKRKVAPKGNKADGTKARRKDKGKARFTAYVLWAREIRQRLAQQCPDMDFAALSKRLGELWSTVPHLEKRNWRRRAKRLVAEASARLESKVDPAWLGTVSRDKPANKIHSAKPEKSSVFAYKTMCHSARSSKKSVQTLASNGSSERARYAGIGAKTRPVGTEPIDVASHLTLLGESLIVIGELLANHKGEIAVSGGLSVLLDSLLCAMGPLICLTRQVPEINGVDRTTLAKILDNVAYIMPGL